MYIEFFGLSEKPFSITPDPRYLYLSERHAEALAHLLYGVTESGGFIQLTGEVGTGKTTLVRSLLEQLPEHARVALVLNPRLSSTEFLEAICEELGINISKIRGSVKGLVDELNACLLDAHAAGDRVVLIVDEAQNLSPDVLEQIRLLTNLETAKQKLLQIILIGQPELREVLARVELRQLAQRITGRYHLQPLSSPETSMYVRHRLSIAGSTSELFPPRALRVIHRASSGVPRLINVICDRALLGAYTREQRQVDHKLARRAVREVFGAGKTLRRNPWLITAGVTAAAAIVAILLTRFDNGLLATTATGRSMSEDGQPVTAPVVTAPAQQPIRLAIADDTSEAAPVRHQLAEILSRHTAETGTDQAFATIFELWNEQASEGDRRPCEQAPEIGLRCVMQRGSWAQVRTLDRPAILSLTDHQGDNHQIVVSGLSDDAATVRFGATEYSVAITDLSRYWFGDYLILWRPQAGSGRILNVGMRGSSVRWLKEQLETMTGNPLNSDDDLYDEELAQAVRAFQRKRRLHVDGIAGVQTQILINNELDIPATPRLNGERS